MNKNITSEYLSKTKLFKYIKNPNIFQYPTWLRTIEECTGYKCFGILTKNNKIPLGVSIFFSTRKGIFFQLAGSPLIGSFTPYIEPIWLEEIDKNTKIEMLISQHLYLKKKGFSYIEWRFKENTYTESLSQHLKYKILTHETYILKIEPDLNMMWKNLKNGCKCTIRKAKKFGVILSKCEGSPEEIELYYSMAKQVFARRGRLPILPVSYHKNIAKNLLPENRYLILSAIYENKIIAMIFFLHNNEELYIFCGASFSEAYKTGANSLILWGAIKFAVENKLKIFDLGGKGRITSINKFKESFGPELHKYGKIVWRTKTVLLAEKIIYKVYPSFKKIKLITSK